MDIDNFQKRINISKYAFHVYSYIQKSRRFCSNPSTQMGKKVQQAQIDRTDAQPGVSKAKRQTSKVEHLIRKEQVKYEPKK